MDFPPYVDRTPEELEEALKWAVLELHLESWDISILAPEEVLELDISSDYLEGNCGMTHIVPSCLRAEIALSTVRLRQQNVDPLHTLFHEVFHIFTWAIDPGESSETHNTLNEHYELCAHTLGNILYDYYSLSSPQSENHG